MMSRLILVRRRNVSDKSCTKIKIHILYPVMFLSENLVVYEIIWENMVQPVRRQESRNGPGVAQRVPGGLGSQIS
jgi:hypothetical protein